VRELRSALREEDRMHQESNFVDQASQSSATRSSPNA
jgi:hypothetical protein